MANTFAAAYRAALQLTGGACPIEAGLLGNLADHECRHGRLPGDGTPPCGCWPEEHRAESPSPPAADAA